MKHIRKANTGTYLGSYYLGETPGRKLQALHPKRRGGGGGGGLCCHCIGLLAPLEQEKSIGDVEVYNCKERGEEAACSAFSSHG